MCEKKICVPETLVDKKNASVLKPAEASAATARLPATGRGGPMAETETAPHEARTHAH